MLALSFLTGVTISNMRIPISAHERFNTRMKTINNIRRDNLALLRDECGGVGKLAERLEKSPSQVSQWLNASANSGTGKPRGISDVACRYMEERFGKPTGWMDAPHTAETVAVSLEGKIDAEDAANLLLLFSKSDEEGKAAILTMARAMAARNESAAAPGIQNHQG